MQGKGACKVRHYGNGKIPKKFRFTLVVRLQNYCLDVIENLLLDLLGYFAMICMETGCILPNQFENISKLQAECILFLGKWISSDQKRNKTPSGEMPQKVIQFEAHLSRNLWTLHYELKYHRYKVDEYRRFMIYDPKEREIQAIPYCDRITCRKGKETDYAINLLRRFMAEHYKKHGKSGYFIKLKKIC